jgi:hypothetical protein
MPLLALLLAAAAPSLPQQFDDLTTIEGWIWQRVQTGKVVDLNDRCGTVKLDTHRDEHPKWEDACRRVDPERLRALLTQPDLADHSPHGVLIIGARIDGDFDLRDADIKAAEVGLDESWVAGGIDLTGARLAGGLSFNGSLAEGKFSVRRAVIGSFLTMQGADLRDSINLGEAHIEDQMDMGGASVAEAFTAVNLHVGAGGLHLWNVKFGGPVDLRGAPC